MYRADESKVAREQEIKEYSDFILKASHVIKEHKTLIQVGVTVVDTPFGPVYTSDFCLTL